jgi:hypothetical protein
LNPETVTPFTTDISFQRRLHLSTNRIFKTKGTRHSIEMTMAMFGLTDDGPTPDYTITEFYNETATIKSTDTFKYYDMITDDPGGIVWTSGVNYFTTFDDAIALLSTPAPPVYVKVTDGGVDYFYELDASYSYEEAVAELYRHKDTERLYNDMFTGVPINEITIGNTKYIVPFYTQKRVYDGYLYFQQKGGWGKKSNTSFQYDYMETVPYMHMIPNVGSLLSIITNDLSTDDIYYVFDTSDYIDYDTNVPFDLSHFFKIHDMYNPQRFSSWRNIPMTGQIVYDTTYNVNDVTHVDYLHAKYLNSIIPTILYNNPHTGFGNYDMGNEYFEYMSEPYKFAYDTYNFTDDKHRNMARQFLFTINRITSLPVNGKFKKWLDTVTYYYSGGTLTSVINNYNSAQYFLDNKVIILKNNINNVFHKKWLRDVVMKYVLQVVPSTAILILEDFETANDTSTMTYYNITTTQNDATYGSTTGDGSYLATTFAVLTATENGGYHFLRWERVSTGDVISTDPITQVLVCGDDDYIAIFEEDCVISVSCDKVCGILLGCDATESCATTFLCETDDQCDIVITCSEAEPEPLAHVAYILKYYNASDVRETVDGLNHKAFVYHNYDTCLSTYNTIYSDPNYIVTDPVTLISNCRVTPYDVSTTNVDPSTLETTPLYRDYPLNSTISLIAARANTGLRLKEWIYTDANGNVSTPTSQTLTLSLSNAGNYTVIAVYEEIPATFNYRLAFYDVANAIDAEGDLNDHCVVLDNTDNTCTAYAEANSDPNNFVTDAYNATCRVTNFPITTGMVDTTPIQTLPVKIFAETTPKVVTYSVGQSIMIVGGVTDTNYTLREWRIKYPDNTTDTISAATNKKTGFICQAGITDVIAVYEKKSTPPAPETGTVKFSLVWDNAVDALDSMNNLRNNPTRCIVIDNSNQTVYNNILNTPDYIINNTSTVSSCRVTPLNFTQADILSDLITGEYYTDPELGVKTYTVTGNPISLLGASTGDTKLIAFEVKLPGESSFRSYGTNNFQLTVTTGITEVRCVYTHGNHSV